MKKPLRILHLEDNALDAELVESALSADGIECEVTKVMTREDYRSALEACGFDLVLADFSLPSFDGMSALEMASRTCLEVPYIFVSGSMGEEVAVESLKKGAVDYVLKTNLSRLAPAVRRALREADDRAARRRTEEALRESEAKLNRAQAVAHLGSWHLDLKKDVLTWSDESYRIFKIPPGTPMSYARFVERVHPDDRAAVHKAWTSALDREPYDIEHRIVIGGETRWVREMAEVEFDEGGRAVAATGTVQDITELKRAKTEADELDELLRTLVEESPSGKFIEQDGRLAYFNEAMSRLYGYTDEEFIKLTPLGRVHPDDRQALTDAVERLGREEAGEIRHEHRIVRKDGAAIYVETHISAVIFRGRPAFMGRVTDITERKMYEQQRADFYAMLTHDIKSPLTTIMGYAELIKLKQGEAGRDVVEMAGYIEEGGEKLIRMVEEFLAVSRIESGKIAFKKTEVHVAALLAKIHRDFGAQARKKGLELNLDAAGGPAVAVLDKMYVEMAVSNLVQNAVNYTPAGGRITIKAENAPGGEGLLAISVTDSGPGIPAEALGRVFEKYYRVPGSGVKGSGLGLAVVKMVAEAHGGSIEMECPEGGGCTFTMVLPVGPGPGA